MAYPNPCPNCGKVIPRDDDTFIRDARIGPAPEPAPGLAGYCRITITLREVTA